MTAPAALIGQSPARAPAAARASRRGRLREAAFWLYLHCGYVAVRDAIRSALGRSRVVVVYYHRVGGCDVLSKPIDQFRSEIAYLRRRYQCMSLAEFCRLLRSDNPIRRRAVIITFDDGYRDNFTAAMPVLREGGVPATFFVATGFISTDRSFPHDSRAGAGRHATLTWEQLRQMQDAGFEIGSHTVEHTNLGLEAADAERELADSLAALERELGSRPRAFSYPWGKPQDIRDTATRAIRSLAYYAACSAYGGANTRGSDPFSIRRVDVGNGRLSMLAFRARVAGFDPDFLRLRLSRRGRLP